MLLPLPLRIVIAVAFFSLLVASMVAVTLGSTKGYRTRWKIPSRIGVGVLGLTALLFVVATVCGAFAHADDPAAVLGRLGSALGGGLFGLAFFGAAVAAVTLACVRKTPLWILLGALASLFLLCALGGVIQGILKRNAASAAATAAQGIDDFAAPTQGVSGKSPVYSYLVPKGWIVHHGEAPGEGGTTQAAGRNVNVEVMGEEGYYGDASVVIGAVKQRVALTAAEVTWLPVETETIDGRTWLTTTYRKTFVKPPITVTCRVHCYAGPEGSYTFLAWTAPNLFDRYQGQMDRIFRTFRLPPAPPAAAAVAAPAANGASSLVPGNSSIPASTAAASDAVAAPAPQPPDPAPEPAAGPAAPLTPPAPVDPNAPVS